MQLEAAKRVMRRHPLLAGAFALSVVLALVFAGRFVVQFTYWQMHREQPVRAWMTPGYVARSWGLDPRDVAAVIDYRFEHGKRLTLEDIARARGVPVETLVADLERKVEAMKAAQTGVSRP